jgi:hypothetical protein
MTAEYAVPTVPFGSEVVVIATVPKHVVPSRSRGRRNMQVFTAPCCRAFADSRKSQRFPDFCCLPPNYNEIGNIPRKTRRFPDYRFAAYESSQRATLMLVRDQRRQSISTTLLFAIARSLNYKTQKSASDDGNETSFAYSNEILRRRFCLEFRTSSTSGTGCSPNDLISAGVTAESLRVASD